MYKSNTFFHILLFLLNTGRKFTEKMKLFFVKVFPKKICGELNKFLFKSFVFIYLKFYKLIKLT